MKSMLLVVVSVLLIAIWMDCCSPIVSAAPSSSSSSANAAEYIMVERPTENEHSLEEIISDFASTVQMCSNLRELLNKELRDDKAIYNNTLEALVKLNNMASKISNPYDLVRVMERLSDGWRNCGVVLTGIRIPLRLPAVVVGALTDPESSDDGKRRRKRRSASFMGFFPTLLGRLWLRNRIRNITPLPASLTVAALPANQTASNFSFGGNASAMVAMADVAAGGGGDDGTSSNSRQKRATPGLLRRSIAFSRADDRDKRAMGLGGSLLLYVVAPALAERTLGALFPGRQPYVPPAGPYMMTREVRFTLGEDGDYLVQEVH